MRGHWKAAVVVALVGSLVALGGAALALDLPGMKQANEAVGGGLEAPAVGKLGGPTPGPCQEQIFDLPAINACRDAEGRVVMDLPALKVWSGPRPAPGPGKLPVTGVDAGEVLALGLAALAAGGVLVRRVRMSLA